MRNRNYYKKKNVKKEKVVDKRRIVGYTQMKVPVYGSKSQLVRPLTIHSLAPFDLYDKIEKEYNKSGLNIFKKYTNNTLYRCVWDE